VSKRRGDVSSANISFSQCDRELPVCRKCKEAGSTCIQRRLGVQLDPSQPEPVSYIESLRDRVQQLELRISEVQKSPSSAVEVRSGPSHLSPTASGPRRGEETAPARQIPSHGATKHVMDYLPLSAMAEPRDRQHMPRGQYSFETFLNTATSASGADVTRSDASSAPLRKVIEDFHKDAIPSGIRLTRSISDFPVECYLAMCDILCPFLDREAFLGKYAAILEEIEKGTLQAVTTDAPHDLFMVYMGVATGVLLAPEYQYKDSFAISLAHEALRLLPRIMRESEDPLVVRSLTALAIFSIYSPLGGSTWHLVGLAIARSMSAGRSRINFLVRHLASDFYL
jgi:hypothetical protein